jgi:hypothetical protein
MDTRCPPIALRKFYECFVSLNVDDVNLQDFVPRKDFGGRKKEKKLTILVISFICLGYF